MRRPWTALLGLLAQLLSQQREFVWKFVSARLLLQGFDKLPFFRSGNLFQAVLLPSYSSTAFSKAPLLHGRYPASSLVWASPTPGQSRSLSYGFHQAVGSGRPFPPCRVSQVPRLIFPRVLSPNTPEGPVGAFARCFPTDVRLHHLRQTGHLRESHEADSGSLALRPAGLLPRFPPDGLLHPAPVQLHVRTSNLHGELLSVHKINQAYPGVPKAQRREDSKGPSSLAAFETLSLDSSPQIMLEPSQVRRPGLPELSNLVSTPAEAGGLPGSE